MPDDIVLILADGEWRGAARLQDLAMSAGRILAADGAWAKAIADGIPVDTVIGDLDSLTSKQREALLDADVEVHAYAPEKDLTDLELAVDIALAGGPRRLIVFGAFGGRIDHTLANVLMLEKAVARGVDVELIVGEETAWLIRDGFTLPIGRPGDRVSLIPLSDEAVVRTEGLAYPLDDETLARASAHGVSNVIETLPVRIALRSGTLLVVHGPTEGGDRA